MSSDPANGYERVAAEFMTVRSDSGTAIVEAWAASLPKNSSVLDVGSGHGYPLSAAILRAGCQLSAIDASPTMVAAFETNFPDVRIACETAQTSDFFGTTYDGIMAIGLLFLLPETAQNKLIQRVARALKPGGRFLFSAPEQRCEWIDILTGQTSYGLGIAAYEAILARSGLKVLQTHKDEGGSHYYDTQYEVT